MMKPMKTEPAKVVMQVEVIKKDGRTLRGTVTGTARPSNPEKESKQ